MLTHLMIQIPDPYFQVGQQHPDGELLQKFGDTLHVSGGEASPIALGGYRGTGLGLPCPAPWHGAPDVSPPQPLIPYVAVALCFT